jgi:hypothetical protein
MKKVLYYFVMQPYDQNNSYVKIQYVDGSITCLYPEDKGYKSAKNKAMNSR